MLNLPNETLVDKRIPKTKFYEKLKPDSGLRQKFIDQVDYIVWKHKLSPDTIKIGATSEVEEIQIFEVYLKQQNLAREVLEQIDRAIPYPIIFALVYQTNVQLAVAYKRRSKHHQNRFVVDSYHYSAWQGLQEVALEVKGLNLQDVYQNILKCLLPESARDKNLEQAVQDKKAADKLKRDIIALKAKIKKERQFNRKVEYNLELQEKLRELEKIVGEKQ